MNRKQFFNKLLKEGLDRYKETPYSTGCMKISDPTYAWRQVFTIENIQNNYWTFEELKATAVKRLVSFFQENHPLPPKLLKTCFCPELFWEMIELMEHNFFGNGKITMEIHDEDMDFKKALVKRACDDYKKLKKYVEENLTFEKIEWPNRSLEVIFYCDFGELVFEPFVLGDLK